MNATEFLSGLNEQQLRAWLEDAVQNYVDNSQEPFRKFEPLVIPDSEHLAPAVSYFFSLLPSDTKRKFRAALSDAALELSPLSPIFTRLFATYCELAAYIHIPAIVEAVRAHVLVGRLRSPRNDLELEASGIAIQAVDMLSPLFPQAKSLLRELYYDASIRATHPTALMSALCEIAPVNWPLFVRDFTNSPVFERFYERSERLVGPLENVVRAVPLPVIAGELYQLVTLTPPDVSDLLFSALFAKTDSPLVLFNENLLALDFPVVYPERSEYGSSAYGWFLSSRENLNIESRMPWDPTLLLEVEFAPTRTPSDGDFVDLLNRFAINVEVKDLLKAA